MLNVKRRQNLLLFGLFTAAIAAGVNPVPIFPGVPLLLAGSAWLLILLRFGLWAGLAGAVVSGLFTVFVWNHAWLTVTMAAEALVIGGVLYRWPRTPLLAAAGLFWFILAPPVFYLVYVRILSFGLSALVLFYLIQSISGLINAGIAGGLHALWKKAAGENGLPRGEQLRALFSALFPLPLIVVLAAGLFITALHAWNFVDTVEGQVDMRLETAARYASEQVTTDYGEIQSLLTQHAVNHEPENSLKDSLEGLPSFRQFLRIDAILADDDEPYIHFFSGNQEPASHKPWNKAARKHELLPIILSLPEDSRSETVFVHEDVILQGQVRTVLDRDLQYRFAFGDQAPENPSDYQAIDGLFGRLRNLEQTVLEENPVYRSGSMGIPETPNWQVIVEMPMDYYRQELFQLYMGNFGLIWLFALLSAAGAWLVYCWILLPVGHLQVRAEGMGTHNQGSADDISLPWPGSPFRAVRRLITNVQSLAQILQQTQEEKESAQSQLSFMDTHDPLTMLPNRRSGRQTLERAIASSRAEAKPYPVGLLLMDLDSFKDVHAAWGYAAGDDVLKAAAHRIKRETAPKGTLFRYGGDTFALVVPRFRGAKHLRRLAGRICQAMHEPLAVNGSEFEVKLSIGISTYPQHGSSSEVLLKKADLALRQAKGSGPGHIVFFEPTAAERPASGVQFNSEMQRAVEREELVPYFQPLIDARSKKCIGAEVLLRWQHPRWGTILPADFVPLADRHGQIAVIGRWLSEQACRCLQQWQGPELGRLFLSINVSESQLQPWFVEDLKRTLQETGAEPHRLQLEIGESTAVSQQVRVGQTIQRLQSMGVATVIDNFGTGQASLACLQTLSLYGLKVDRLFVAQSQRSTRDAQILEGTAALAKSLHLHVTAEGVETREQAELVHRLGYDSLQGFYYAQPMPAERFQRWVREWNHD